MNILAIDTSCDETAVAVTRGTKILSNTIWSQASLHTKWGGIHPSLAQREHEKKIEWVIKKAMTNAKCPMANVSAIAVTVGPGLAVSLQVGIRHAKRLAKKLQIPLITVNHIEGHVLSPLAKPRQTASTSAVRRQRLCRRCEESSPVGAPPSKKKARKDTKLSIFPAFGLVVSGGTTQLIHVVKIGNYKIVAQTTDDALGEALDKAARMLGLGYPGGAVLEKMAKEGNPNFYDLPIPMLGREKERRFSYSGLKTAMWRLTESEKQKGALSKTKIQNLAASFQDKAFTHLTKVATYAISEYQKNRKSNVKKHCHCERNEAIPSRSFTFDKLRIQDDKMINSLLVGGGVGANVELRKRLRKMAKKLNIKVHFPYTKKLYTDNAAMIGVVAYFKFKREEVVNTDKLDLIDREPRAKIDKPFAFEESPSSL